MKRELEEELGWTPSEFKFLLTWEELVPPCITYIYAAPLTVATDQLILTEGQALGLFTLAELLQLSTVPHLKENLPQVIEVIASEKLQESWHYLNH